MNLFCIGKASEDLRENCTKVFTKWSCMHKGLLDQCCAFGRRQRVRLFGFSRVALLSTNPPLSHVEHSESRRKLTVNKMAVLVMPLHCLLSIQTPYESCYSARYDTLPTGVRRSFTRTWGRGNLQPSHIPSKHGLVYTMPSEQFAVSEPRTHLATRVLPSKPLLGEVEMSNGMESVRTDANTRRPRNRAIPTGLLEKRCLCCRNKSLDISCGRLQQPSYNYPSHSIRS